MMPPPMMMRSKSVKVSLPRAKGPGRRAEGTSQVPHTPDSRCSDSAPGPHPSALFSSIAPEGHGPRAEGQGPRAEGRGNIASAAYTELALLELGPWPSPLGPVLFSAAYTELALLELGPWPSPLGPVLFSAAHTGLALLELGPWPSPLGPVLFMPSRPPVRRRVLLS